MTIEELFNMWTKDSEIDQLDLGNESIKTTKLHSKYVRLYTEYRLKAQKLQYDFNSLKGKKIRYYSGLMDATELKQNNWEQFPERIRNKETMVTYLDGDKDLAIILEKKAFNEELAEFCKEVLKSIHSRTWNIKTAVDHARFMQGG